MNDFKRGDVVKHKSGGAKMAISDQLSENTYTCEWLEKGKRLNETFTADVLVKIEENKTGGWVMGLYDDDK